MTELSRRTILVGAVILFLVALPELRLSVPGILPGATSSAGSLQLLASCLLIGALAVTYDLLFGIAGLLSFGHALFFATGCYVFAISLEQWHLPILPAAALTLVVGSLTALVVGLVSLRVRHIAFAMVTLAFAQAGSLLVFRNFGGYTGGEEGLGLVTAKLPGAFIGVENTKNLYWLALATAVVVYAAVAWLTRTRAGRMMAAVRENDLRVQVIGIRPYTVRLIAFVAAGALATLIGMSYTLLHSAAGPQVTTPAFTLSLLVMVVLGGAGFRWGALLGGVLYTWSDQRLAVLASSSGITALPGVLRVPLSQPLFLLGTLFVLVVLFLPGGLAGAICRVRRGAERRSAPVAATGADRRRAA